ncbi:MAG TPA: DUF3558 domain-containing protein [Mycobacterium sp.]|nr:DUF3558 domain-containing protein [Mycobacterium sp.]
MATRVRLFAVLCTLVAAVVLVWHSSPANLSITRNVQLRATAAPLDEPTTTIKSPVIATVNPRPFAPCEDIPIDVIQRLGLGFTPPEPEEGLRCHFDAANYQMAIEPIVWRTYDQSLAPDAIETDIDGHRAAWYWVMKPTDWDNKWWFSCMVVFKTSYGVIQQSLFYSPVYSDPDVDCPAENLMRAHQLAPYYKF